MAPAKKKPAVFLDRDGTILDERGYLSDPRKLRFYPWAFQALKNLRQAGFELVIVTNQSGVGRGYFSESRLREINNAFRKACLKRKIVLSGIYYCPHLPTKGCACRKPGTKMISQAVRKQGLSLENSYVVGDQWRDVEMGFRAHCTPVLVLTGGGKASRQKAKKKAAKISTNLLFASRWIVQDFLKRKNHV